jgi:transposase-like protein
MNIVQIYKQFPTEEDCICHIEQVRWHGTPICPYCGSDRVSANEHRHHCNGCNTSFSVTVKTIFHHTHLPLQKWFLALSLVLNAKKGLSARQLARDLEVNKNTAWFMGMRIRNAMFEQGELLRGIVEMDETYIGGKQKGTLRKAGFGDSNKLIVVGIRQRGGPVRFFHAEDAKSGTLARYIQENISQDVDVIVTDEYRPYRKAVGKARHETVNHSAKEYVRFGTDIHTNTVESAFSLLKRGIIGTWHRLSAKHLQAYLDEMSFRFDRRNRSDLFLDTLRHMVTADPMTFEELVA